MSSFATTPGTTSLPLLPSFRRQQLLLEFASLKHHCPEGIYLTLNPSDPSSWSGILFVREGAYSSAVLHFEILFPSYYAESLPLVSFSTEIFHPLLVPLTTYSFGGGVDPSATYGASETERLPPGCFCLKHEFPQWTSRHDRGRATAQPVNNELDSSVTKNGDGQSQNNANSNTPSSAAGTGQMKQTPVISILRYIKAAFEDSALLDSIPFEAAGNPSAWHAWRSYRGLSKQTLRSASPAGRGDKRLGSSSRNPAEWNWDGLWEARVRNGIDESISDALLYGSKNVRNLTSSSGPIRFSKFDDEKLENIQAEMLRLHGFDPVSTKT